QQSAVHPIPPSVTSFSADSCGLILTCDTTGKRAHGLLEFSVAMAEGTGAITRLLKDWREGDPEAATKLFPLVFNDLKSLAATYLRRERDISICRTELVHELYLKLPVKMPEFENRSHFFGIAARLMRQILVDLARQRKRLKRQAPATILLDPPKEPD